MDFTYFVALALSVVVGFAAAIIFVARRGQSKRRLLAYAVVVSVIVDFALLIDWARIQGISLGFLAFDLAFFMIYGLLGCAIGALPVLALRKALRDRG